jgi:Domain of unknown function (DUF4397)
MKLGFISAGLALAAVLAACNPTPTPAAKANIRAVHASVDTPAVDILVDSVKAGGPIEFKSAFPATGYAAVDSGVRNIKVCAAPADTTCPIDASPTLAPSAKYTIVALGTIATADDTGADARPLEPLVLPDTEAAPAADPRCIVGRRKNRGRLHHRASCRSCDSHSHQGWFQLQRQQWLSRGCGWLLPRSDYRTWCKNRFD